MPGWMGLRGLSTKSVHSMERERRDTHTAVNNSEEIQRRADEKVQEILREQQGDMAEFTGIADAAGVTDADGDVCMLPLSRIMSSRVAVLSYDDSLLVVQGIFAAVRFRHLPVVDDNGGIIGIVSDRDILRMASPFFGTVNEQTRDKEIMTHKVGISMTRNPVCGRPDTTVLAAVKMMNARKISCLPVIDSAENRKLLGIVTWKDIVRAFCSGGFDRSRDSQRLRTGVKVAAAAGTSAAAGMPAPTEETRIIERAPAAAAAAVAQEKPPLSFEQSAELASKRLAARVRAARGENEDGESRKYDPNETPFFPLPPASAPEADGQQAVHALRPSERLSPEERLRQSERIRQSERQRLARAGGTPPSPDAGRE